MPAQQDRKEIKQTFLPVSVICNKYDVFAVKNEPKFKKTLCSALRYLCHLNGADLIFSSIQESQPMKIFKNLTSYYSFKDIAGSSNQANPEGGEGA